MKNIRMSLRSYLNHKKASREIRSSNKRLLRYSRNSCLGVKRSLVKVLNAIGENNENRTSYHSNYL